MELLKETEAAQLMDHRRARADSEISDHSDASASEDGEDEGEPTELREVS